MKLTEQQQAQFLYVQTDLSKTDIADQLAISRTTLHQWIRDNNWERLRRSGEFIPAFIAENIYQAIGNLSEHILSEERVGKPITLQEANTMYKLTLTIGKLKTRPTLNENMETFARFTEHLVNKDYELAKTIQPHINDFIHAQAAPTHKQYRPVKLDTDGYIPTPGPISQYFEKELDKDDYQIWAQQQQAIADQPATEPAKQPVTQQPLPSQPIAVQPATTEPVTSENTATPPKAPVYQRPAENSTMQKMRGTYNANNYKPYRKNRPIAA